MIFPVVRGRGPAGRLPLFRGDRNVSVVSCWGSSVVPLPPWCSSVGAADRSASEPFPTLRGHLAAEGEYYRGTKQQGSSGNGGEKLQEERKARSSLVYFNHQRWRKDSRRKSIELLSCVLVFTPGCGWIMRQQTTGHRHVNGPCTPAWRIWHPQTRLFSLYVMDSCFLAVVSSLCGCSWLFRDISGPSQSFGVFLWTHLFVVFFLGHCV